MPIEGMRLVIEPTYPRAAELGEIGRKPRPESTGEPEPQVRNVFYSMARRCDIYVYEREPGRVTYGIVPKFHGFDHLISCLGVADAWGIEQEANAVKLLGEHTTHRQFKQYLITGMFLEKSKRSGLTYMFRRLRPTVVIDARDRGTYEIGETQGRPSRETSSIVCALCLHPIAYYSGSWAGAMCPTDDVIAHLMLMRGDEPMFWRRANQHPAWRPEAGL